MCYKEREETLKKKNQTDVNTSMRRKKCCEILIACAKKKKQGIRKGLWINRWKINWTNELGSEERKWIRNKLMCCLYEWMNLQNEFMNEQKRKLLKSIQSFGLY